MTVPLLSERLGTGNVFSPPISNCGETALQNKKQKNRRLLGERWRELSHLHPQTLKSKSQLHFSTPFFLTLCCSVSNSYCSLDLLCSIHCEHLNVCGFLFNLKMYFRTKPTTNPPLWRTMIWRAWVCYKFRGFNQFPCSCYWKPGSL